MMFDRTRSGFTLFEVLLVIAILALLAAFVLPQFIGVGDQAKVDLAKSAIGPTGPIAKALDLYRMAMGKYPEGEDGLKKLITKPDDEEEAKKWHGPYIDDETNLRDPWGHEYRYRFPGEKREDKYDLWSVGKDGEDGTDDDVKNWQTDEETRSR
jgi:general secretion pathway protein G